MGEHDCRMKEIQRDEDKEPSDEELEKAILHFLEEFPREREKIEGWLRCLQEKADVIDKTSKGGTIANLSTSSARAVSGALSIAGLILAPVTAGISLIATASGLGIGIANEVAGIVASGCEHRIHSEEMKTIEKLIKNCEESLKKVLSLDKIGFSFGLCSGSSPKQKTSEDGIVNINPTGLTLKALPAMANLAKKTTALGKLFKGTALAMSKGARGIALSGFSLAVDIGFIVLDSIKLALGAKTKEAAKIRHIVNMFEKVVQLLSTSHEGLKDAWEYHGP